MSKNFNDKHYVIFGGTGGIGSVICDLLHKSDAFITVVGRNEKKLKELSERFNCNTIKISDAGFKQIENTFEKIHEKNGKIDGIVNCIGSLLLKPAHKTSEEEWQAVIDTNLGSSFAVIKHGAEIMKEQKNGSMVFISSAAGVNGFSSHDAIAAAKAGIAGLVKSAASTYSRYGIRINCVAPGLVDTPLTKSLTSSEAIMKKSEKMHPLGRIGKPEDVASAVCWLLSPEQSWITGQTLSVDGGITAIRN